MSNPEIPVDSYTPAQVADHIMKIAPPVGYRKDDKGVHFTPYWVGDFIGLLSKTGDPNDVTRRRVGFDRLQRLTQGLTDVEIETPRMYFTPNQPTVLVMDPIEGASLSPKHRQAVDQATYANIPTETKVAGLTAYLKALQAINNQGYIFGDHQSESVFMRVGPTGKVVLSIVDPGNLEDVPKDWTMDPPTQPPSLDRIRECREWEFNSDGRVQLGKLLMRFFDGGGIPITVSGRTVELTNAVPAQIRRLAEEVESGKVGSTEQILRRLGAIPREEIESAEQVRIAQLGLNDSNPSVHHSRPEPTQPEQEEVPDYEGDPPIGSERRVTPEERDIAKRISAHLALLREGANDTKGMIGMTLHIANLIQNAQKDGHMPHPQVYTERLTNAAIEGHTKAAQRELLKKGWTPPQNK